MLHTFVALVQDKPGVLTRVASLLCLGYLSLCMTSLSSRALAQTSQIRVQLLDGHTGKIVPTEHVTLFDTSSAFRAELEGHKRDDIYAFDVQPGMKLTLGIVQVDASGKGAYNPFYRDSHDGNLRFTPGEIMQTGVVSPNHCNRNVKASPTPGSLLIFVRPFNAWERFLRSIDK